MRQLLIICGATAIVSFLSTACWTDASSVSTPKPSLQISKADVTAQELIENPERYDGKEVTAIGIASIEFENTTIRSPRSDTTYADSAVWLEFQELKPEYKKFDRQRVQVRGVFHAGKLGHLGTFQGAITNIKEIKILGK